MRNRWLDNHDGTISIFLRGMLTPVLIDEADFDLVKPYTWRLDKTRVGKTTYAKAHQRLEDGTAKTIRMHSVILGAEQGQFCDHANFNGLCNVRSNLRICTRSQNAAHSNKQKNTSSKYKGISASKNKWRAFISVNGKSKALGTFTTELAAAMMYDLWAVKLFGKFAVTNRLLGLLPTDKLVRPSLDK